MRLLAIIVFAACGSRDAETPSSPASVAGEIAQRPQQASSAAELPVDPAPVPAVELLGLAVDDGVSLRLRALGPEGVALRRRVQIERRNGDDWESTDATYSLAVDCERPDGDCLSLAAGAELTAPALGAAAGQCGGAGIEPGDYRFVVNSCAPEGTRPHRLEGVFTVVESR